MGVADQKHMSRNLCMDMVCDENSSSKKHTEELASVQQKTWEES